MTVIWNFIIESIEIEGWIVGLIVGLVYKYISRKNKLKKNKKSYHDHAINFKSIAKSGIKPIAHGEPFWSINDNNLTNPDNRFYVSADTNGLDKSKGNEYIVDNILSERIGEKEEPKQVIKLKKVKSTPGEKLTGRFGIKTLILTCHSDIYTVYLKTINNGNTDVSFESLMQTSDLGGVNPVFTCVEKSWNKIVEKYDFTSDFPKLSADMIKYGDLYKEGEDFFMTSFIIFDTPYAEIVDDNVRSIAGVKKVVMSHKSENGELSIKELFDSSSTVTPSCNYALQMIFARIINGTAQA